MTPSLGYRPGLQAGKQFVFEVSQLIPMSDFNDAAFSLYHSVVLQSLLAESGPGAEIPDGSHSRQINHLKEQNASLKEQNRKLSAILEKIKNDKPSMTVVRTLANYNFSTDYAELFALAKTQSVVCEVDYYECRDVAHTIYRDGGTVDVGARGICYVSGQSLEEFTKGCQSVGLKWIVPTST